MLSSPGINAQRRIAGERYILKTLPCCRRKPPAHDQTRQSLPQYRIARSGQITTPVSAGKGYPHGKVTKRRPAQHAAAPSKERAILDSRPTLASIAEWKGSAVDCGHDFPCGIPLTQSTPDPVASAGEFGTYNRDARPSLGSGDNTLGESKKPWEGEPEQWEGEAPAEPAVTTRPRNTIESEVNCGCSHPFGRRLSQ
jgi:hypothetical protein